MPELRREGEVKEIILTSLAPVSPLCMVLPAELYLSPPRCKCIGLPSFMPHFQQR
jgi:hypothetical protein